MLPFAFRDGGDRSCAAHASLGAASNREPCHHVASSTHIYETSAAWMHHSCGEEVYFIMRFKVHQIA